MLVKKGDLEGLELGGRQCKGHFSNIILQNGKIVRQLISGIWMKSVPKSCKATMIRKATSRNNWQVPFHYCLLLAELEYQI